MLSLYVFKRSGAWGEFVEVSSRFIFPDHVLNSPDHCFIYYKEKFHADHSFALKG